ncbi:response regulator [Herbaspirillum frisingense]|uniref:response regulator n=1 Tax=Herbaspirillum frisingense TaxID=92645 RepID=UPI0039AEAB58
MNEDVSKARCLLIIEDDKEVRNIFVEAFQAEGYYVLDAGNGEEAFDVMQRSLTRVDVILTDLRMPVMDGLEFAIKSRADKRYAGIPILLLSATPIRSSTENLAVFSSVLLKPCPLTSLISTVEAACAVAGSNGLN